MTFTQQQIEDFVAYEEVRQSGEYNMYDWRAHLAAGLSKKDAMFVQKHYSELKKQYAEQNK